MPVIFKAIAPRKLNEKAFADAIEARAKDVKDGILRDYQRTTETWEHKVEFTSEIVVNLYGGVAIHVDTQDEIYTYVHEGTAPHIIKAKRAKRLRFQDTYTAKTVPGVIRSKSGGPSGNPVYAAIVHHPGTEPRLFSKIIMAKWRPYFEREMDRALKEGAEKSGHAI